MARKTVEVVITDEGRDKGKTYVITEMSARRAEKWASQALIAMGTGTGSAIREEVDANTGWAGLMAVGLKALGGIDWKLAEPLMDEMMTCVQIKPDAKNPFTRALSEAADDVEEVATLIRIRTAALELHGNFSFADVLSRLRSLATSAPDSSSTQTSPDPSA